MESVSNLGTFMLSIRNSKTSTKQDSGGRKHHNEDLGALTDITKTVCQPDPELKTMEEGRMTIDTMIREHFPKMRTKTKFIEES